MIFEYARKLSNSIGITNEPLISHYEDNSLERIVRKYYWYGKSQRVLNLIGESETTRFSTHFRKQVPLLDRFRTLPISAARSFPFLLGYVFGRD